MRLYNYWLLLIWPFFIGLLGLVMNMKREEVVGGHRVVRWTPLAALVLVLPLVIWAGGRRFLWDTEVYRSTFQAMPSSLTQVGEYMQGVTKGYGFKLLEVLFKCLISRSDVALFTTIAAVQIFCIFYVYRKYSTNYWLSIFLFIASTDYLLWMYNGIRQFLAVTILLFCVPMIARKRYVPAVILVLLCSQIHAACLIFLPFIFIVNGRSWNLKTILFIGGVILAVIFVDRVTGFLVRFMEDTAYEGDIVILKTNDGTNLFRVLFYSVPAIMCWFFRSYLDRANDPLINVCANLSIVTAGFYVFSFFTSGILMGAIPIYFSLSNYILIPWLIKEIFNRESKLVLEAVFVLVYTGFFYYQCGPTWGLL